MGKQWWKKKNELDVTPKKNSESEIYCQISMIEWKDEREREREK